MKIFIMPRRASKSTLAKLLKTKVKPTNKNSTIWINGLEIDCSPEFEAKLTQASNELQKPKAETQSNFARELTALLIKRMRELNRFSSGTQLINRNNVRAWDAIAVYRSNCEQITYSIATKEMQGCYSPNVRTIFEYEIDEWVKKVEKQHV